MPPYMTLVVATPETKLLEANVQWAQVPLSDGGSIGIFPGHGPLVAETSPGVMRYDDGTGVNSLRLRAGVLRVEVGRATVYTTGLSEGADSEVAAEPEGTDETVHRLVTTLLRSSLDSVKASRDKPAG